jgi:hypothetical protein
MSKERAVVELYGYPDPSSSKSRARFAARIVLQTSLIYIIAFVLFTVLSIVPSWPMGSTCNLVGVSVRLTRSAERLIHNHLM